MSSISVVSNSSLEVESDSSNDEPLKDESRSERKFVLPNELYKSLLASAVLGKTVLNHNLSFKDNLSSFKGNLTALDSALKELKDKGLTLSSVPAFPRNLALRREEPQEKSSFAWSEGGEEGGGGGAGSGGGSGGGAGGGGGAAGGSGNASGGSAGGGSGTGTGASGNSASGGGGPGTVSASAGASGGLAHWVSVMAEHIHNPHSAAGVHHQQQSPPQAPYPWNNGLSTDQCNPHDKESDYWGGARGAKQGYEAKMNAEHSQMQKGYKMLKVREIESLLKI